MAALNETGACVSAQRAAPGDSRPQTALFKEAAGREGSTPTTPLNSALQRRRTETFPSLGTAGLTQTPRPEFNVLPRWSRRIDKQLLSLSLCAEALTLVSSACRRSRHRPGTRSACRASLPVRSQNRRSQRGASAE
ncbi:hypothetical protein AAFF_G00006080 [Aldrovandia affinis]|uniref:Uncharacterized protein n=1 Tax=Aldrovandia affinis TaxID=143900 RepID=A0AAD7TDQ8_9TELE|nr:hypothetical protein AAFF_G00006080 [Aldrovandia affinis]